MIAWSWAVVSRPRCVPPEETVINAARGHRERVVRPWNGSSCVSELTKCFSVLVASGVRLVLELAFD